MRSGLTAAVVALLCALSLVATAHAAFPGANGKIAYVPGHGSIWSVAPDASIRTPLFQANGVADPEWSPDGSRIAFSFGGIWVMKSDGTGATRVTSGLDRDPTWSPDGRRIAFVSERIGATIALWVMNVDGSGMRPLTDPPLIGAQPAWSPDGTKIAYVGFTPVPGSPRVNQDIYTVNADGTGVTNLTAGVGQELTPDWAPDGSRIAFASDLETRLDSTNLYTIRPDGSDLSRLTFATNNVHEFGPAWSPDGARIAYVTTDDPPGEQDAGEDVDIINADGTGPPVRVTPSQDNVHNDEPDWQPLVAPRRTDFKNDAKFCKAEREFFGEDAFRQKYGGGADAYGKCVSGK